MCEKVSKIITNIFLKSVSSVQIPNIIRNNVHYDKTADILNIYNFPHNLNNKDVHIVGAGKAVFQMALEVENILRSKIKSGIVSIPMGALNRSLIPPSSVIEYYEGAENNLPDVKAECTTTKIMNLVKNLDHKSVVIVLLSGGGSALLTAPISPITLGEKTDLIKMLANSGADIVELNTVRKCLSSVKGGKLLSMIYPASTIALMLSDIVGNRSEFIASGPTFKNDDDSQKAIEVIRKYSLESSLKDSIKEVLFRKSIESFPTDINVDNYVIGNNTMAIKAAENEALNMKYHTIFLSDCVHGDVDLLSNEYCRLVCTVIFLLNDHISLDNAEITLKTLTCLSLHDDVFKNILSLKSDSYENGIFMVAGGEPTVNIKGNGKGGRNQELALRFSLNYHFEKQQIDLLSKFDVYMLCAGTDGMDGPTDAAGAIGHSQLISESLEQNLCVETYLSNNDSYNFYRKFDDHNLHIKTGHTNTNVMDMHMILIKPKRHVRSSISSLN